MQRHSCDHLRIQMQSHERKIKIIIWTLIETDHPDFLPLHKLLHCQGSPGNLQSSQFNTYILSNGGEKYKKTNKIKLTKEKENKEISSGNNFFF